MDPNLQPQEDPIAEAIARRGMGDQQAPDISGGQPMAPPTPAPQMGSTAPQGMPAPQADKFVPKDSHELLVSTLQESLKNEYKLKSEQTKFGQQAPMMS